MHFLVGRVSFFSTVWQRGITCLLPTINLGSINPRRASAKTSICYVPSRVQVNLFQKLLFLHQLTHNVTTDCARISAPEKDLLVPSQAI